MSSRPSAITAAGIVLSQPTMQTRPSKRWPRATSSIESAITSRETSDARIPDVPTARDGGRAPPGPPHRDAVGDRDGVDLEGRSARLADALLDVAREQPVVQ